MNGWSEITVDLNSVDDYRTFLKVKQLPAWRAVGRSLWFPSEYRHAIGIDDGTQDAIESTGNLPSMMFDYQRDICELALRKKKFAVFADCGLGKSLILLAYAREVAERIGRDRKVLILTPPMVVPQLIEESSKFLGDTLQVEHVKAAGLQKWLSGDGSQVGITNYEALKKTTRAGKLGAMVLDESSVLKSHYGNYAGICLDLGRGLEYKLCCTGTPAPNDRIEYANHAVFLDRFPNVNSFLATFFINRGQTQERWVLKPHALKPFYRSLSDWCIFLTDPAVYGWQDNCSTLPPINVEIEHVELTKQQRDWISRELGSLIATRAGGITKRSAYGQVSKGHWKGERFDTNKPGYIRDRIASWQDTESTLVWCLYDHEQQSVSDAIGDCESLSGSTSVRDRIKSVDRFKAGECATLISKPRILGFGLNLQVATRQVFSGLQDSYESYYQCVKRSNRIGSKRPLNVHIPVTELEEPMVENVLRKADRVESDTLEQEQLFREVSYR